MKTLGINKLYVVINNIKTLTLTSHFVYKNIVVPSGFIYDGNSIPRAFRWFLGKFEYMRASCVHDWLYDVRCTNNINRKQADNIYRDMLIELGVSKIKANIAYVAIRLFGEKYYKDYS